MNLDLTIDAAWAVGLLLALTRMAAFVVSSPLLAKAVPVPGRLALTVALGLFFAERVTEPLTVFGLIGAAVANAGVGIVLGFLTGIVFQLFSVAGHLVDLSSGLTVASLYDPAQGEQAALFSRLFNLVALTIFVALGGLGLLVRGLALSIEAIPLDGAIAPQSGLVDLVLGLIGKMVLAGLELALPLLAALFLAEVVLGLAARFAPQANLFILGMPAKMLVTLSLSGVVLLLFPEAVSGLLSGIRDTFGDGIRALAPA